MSEPQVVFAEHASKSAWAPWLCCADKEAECEKRTLLRLATDRWNVWHHAEEQFVVRGVRYRVVMPECTWYQPGRWQSMALAVEGFTGATLAHLGTVEGRVVRLLRHLDYAQQHDVLWGAVACESRPRWDRSWVDTRGWGGALLRLASRCAICGRRCGLERQPSQRMTDGSVTHVACFARRQNELDEENLRRCRERWARESVARDLARVRRISEAMQRLARAADDELTLSQVAKRLPWRTSMQALHRMAVRGVLPATRGADKQWKVKGRDVLPLIQKWLDTGRAPCKPRRRRKPRAQESQK